MREREQMPGLSWAWVALVVLAGAVFGGLLGWVFGSGVMR